MSTSSSALPPQAVRAETPRRVPLQIVSPSAEPPDGDGWLKTKGDLKFYQERFL